MAIKEVRRVEEYHRYPNLSSAAIKARLFQRGLKHWYIAHEAFGHKRVYTQEQLRQLLILNFDITSRYAQEIIAAGRDMFWTTTPAVRDSTHQIVLQKSTVRLASPYAVAEALGVKLGTTWDMVQAWPLLSKNLQGVFKDLKDRAQRGSTSPLGRAALTKMLGISKRSQQYYDRNNGDKRLRCDKLVQTFDTAKEARMALEQGIADGIYKPYQYSVVQTGVRVSNPDILKKLTPGDKDDVSSSGGDNGHNNGKSDLLVSVCGIVKRIGNMYEKVPMRRYGNKEITMLGTSQLRADSIMWVPTGMLSDIIGGNNGGVSQAVFA